LMIDAPPSRSAEINAFLARHSLFAAEIHPREGSLEEVFLELTSSSAPTGLRPGMEALADLSVTPTSDIPGTGKRGNI
jgi:ABC-2 type transport system ATP-binding protein